MEPAHTWADPPQGLMDHIFSRLPSFADRACCTGVCNGWRVLATEKEHAAPPLLPCLLRPSTAGASCFHFFSKTSTKPPAVPHARFCGSIPGGWFVVAHKQWRDYALLNLSSGEQISLPDGLRAQEIPLDLRVGAQSSGLVILAATVSPAPTPDGHYVVAGITFGHNNAVVWKPGMDRWIPLEPQQGLRGPALGKRNQILQEELEDVIYYSCDQHEGFFFLTSQEHLLVFDPEEDDDGQISGDLDGYLFPDHLMSSPPEAGQEVAGRYLVESDGRLLMVKRFISPERGTVSFQVFTLEWESSDPLWESSPATVDGKLLFIGRGCSRAIPTGRSGPGFIYFLDDAEGFPDVRSIVNTEKQYRCNDTGWFRYSPEYIEKSWPQGPPPNCSPWIWLYH